MEGITVERVYINLGSKVKVKIEIDFHVTVKKTVFSLSFKKDMYVNDYASVKELTEEETGLLSKRGLCYTRNES